MSDLEYSSTESSTDSEFEEAMDEMERLKLRDVASSDLVDAMRACAIRVSSIDGSVLNSWLRGEVEMEDVVYHGHLKLKDSTLIKGDISPARVDEFRDLAKKVVEYYVGGVSHSSSYIDRVTAAIIQFEYRL